MVEAPLFIRPYLAQLTRSELFLVMTGGMAGIAGTVLVLYATLLAPLIPDAAGAFCDCLGAGRAGRHSVSLIMVPETKDVSTGGTSADPRLAMIPTCMRPRPWTRSSRAPRPGLNCCSTSSPC